jgi:hypothetical protein
MTTTCPLCHTPSPTITDADQKLGGSWQCERCGHHWDALRLGTAAAYAAYDASRAAPLVARLPDVLN